MMQIHPLLKFQLSKNVKPGLFVRQLGLIGPLPPFLVSTPVFSLPSAPFINPSVSLLSRQLVLFVLSPSEPWEFDEFLTSSLFSHLFFLTPPIEPPVDFL